VFRRKIDRIVLLIEIKAGYAAVKTFNSHIVYILYNTIFASEIFAWFMKVLNSIGGVVYECSKENSEVFSSFMDVLKFRHGN